MSESNQVSVVCPKCNKRVRINQERKGKSIKCPSCSTSFAAPSEVERPSTPSAASLPWMLLGVCAVSLCLLSALAFLWLSAKTQVKDLASQLVLANAKVEEAAEVSADLGKQLAAANAAIEQLKREIALAPVEKTNPKKETGPRPKDSPKEKPSESKEPPKKSGSQNEIAASEYKIESWKSPPFQESVSVSLPKLAKQESITSLARSDSGAYAPTISADGRFVAFQSKSKNLVPGVATDDFQVFVHDLAYRTTICVSLDSAGAPRGGSFPQISASGKTVVYLNPNSNGINFSSRDSKVFLCNLETGATTEIDVPGQKIHCASLSPDERWLGIQAESEVHVADLVKKTIARIDDGKTVSGNDSSYAYSGHAWSGNSQLFAFAGVVRGKRTLFVHDLNKQSLENPLASEGTAWKPRDPSLSADGRFLLFCNDASNADGDSVWLHDRQLGKTTKVREKGSIAPSPFNNATLSPDATFVLFFGWFAGQELFETKVGEANVRKLVESPDLAKSSTIRVGMAERGLSKDGRYIVFESQSGGKSKRYGPSVTPDVWICDRDSKGILCVSVGSKSDIAVAKKPREDDSKKTKDFPLLGKVELKKLVGLWQGPTVSDRGTKMTEYFSFFADGSMKTGARIENPPPGFLGLLSQNGGKLTNHGKGLWVEPTPRPVTIKGALISSGPFLREIRSQTGDELVLVDEFDKKATTYRRISSDPGELGPKLLEKLK